MYRLAYLIPRLILLGLAFLAASIAGDTITERMVTAHLENSIGMDVEIGRLRTRTANGKVFVNDLALVDPARPLINLFQADLAFFEVDLSAISKRQLVIENARASQVRLGVPRTSVVSDSISKEGSPLDSINDVTGFESSQVGRFLANHDGIRMAWLDQFRNQTPAVIAEPKKPETNELYNLASVTNQKWNKDFQQQNGQLKAVSASFAKFAKDQPSAEEIERNGLNGPPNPLRRRVDDQQQESELDEIIERLERLQRQQALLERQAAADLARLEAAYQNESASQDQTQPIELEVSPETLSQLLLADLHQSIANEAMSWFAAVRDNVPTCALSDRAGHTQPRRSPARGEVVEVTGAAQKLPTVIKKLTFDGSGRLNERHVNFAGEAYDITDQPTTHSLPTTFKLRAQGDHHFVLQGSIDRRSAVCSDSVTIDFPAFPLGPQNLGTAEDMLVTTGPRTTTHGAIHLKVDGQTLTGTMRLDFSDVALVVEHLHDVAGGKEVALRLNQSLATLQQFQSTATFGGTLDHPHLKFESSLGEKLAVAMTQINNGKVNENQVATKVEVDQFYNTQVLPLKKNIAMELDSINRSIDSQIGLAQRMRASLRTAKSPKSRWPEMR